MTAEAKTAPTPAPSPAEALLERLVRFEPTGTPVLSLYLDARADQHGRRRYDAFVRRELTERIQSFPKRSPVREGLTEDAERIGVWLRDAVRPSANGIALFACTRAGLFETLQLEAPFPEHRCVVQDRPWIYDLARLLDQRPRWAACIADTNAARIFVFGHGMPPETRQIEGTRTHRTDAGGWAQMRYQRHVEAYQQHHAKEVVAMLEQLVRDDGVRHLVLSGDEVIIPLIRAELPKALLDLVVDVLHLDMRTGERQALEKTLASLRAHDARSDAERVAALLDQYRAGGLGVVGVEATRQALEQGQVDTLVLCAQPDAIGSNGRGAALGDALVAQARRTGGHVRFIEDPALLADVEGVGALLRYRITGPEASA